MVTAIESGGSRTRLYPVPGAASTWRAYRDGLALGRVMRLGESFHAVTAGGERVPGSYPTRRLALRALEAWSR